MPKLILILTLFSLYAFADDSREEMIKDFLRQRERIMQDMMDSFDNDDFFNGSTGFDDSIIDKFDKSFFRNNSLAKEVLIDQKKMPNGDIVVKITPKKKNIKLDIKTDENEITVISKKLIEQKDEGQDSHSFMKSSSTSTQSIGVPFNYEITGPVKEGESIIYTMKKKMSGKAPVKKSKWDKTI